MPEGANSSDSTIFQKFKNSVVFASSLIGGLLLIVLIPSIGLAILENASQLGELEWLGQLIGTLILLPFVLLLLGAVVGTNTADEGEEFEEDENIWVSRTRKYVGWSIWHK